MSGSDAARGAPAISARVPLRPGAFGLTSFVAQNA